MYQKALRIAIKAIKMGKVTIRLIKPKWVFLQLIKVQEHGISCYDF